MASTCRIQTRRRTACADAKLVAYRRRRRQARAMCRRNLNRLADWRRRHQLRRCDKADERRHIDASSRHHEGSERTIAQRRTVVIKTASSRRAAEEYRKSRELILIADEPFASQLDEVATSFRLIARRPSCQ